MSDLWPPGLLVVWTGFRGDHMQRRIFVKYTSVCVCVCFYETSFFWFMCFCFIFHHLCILSPVFMQLLWLPVCSSNWGSWLFWRKSSFQWCWCWRPSAMRNETSDRFCRLLCVERQSVSSCMFHMLLFCLWHRVRYVRYVCYVCYVRYVRYVRCVWMFAVCLGSGRFRSNQADDSKTLTSVILVERKEIPKNWSGRSDLIK